MSQGYKFTNMDDIQTYEQLKKKHAVYFESFNDMPPVSIAFKINEELLLLSKNDEVDEPDFIYESEEIHGELGFILLSEYRKEQLRSEKEINDGSILFWAIFEREDFEFIKNILEKSVDVNKITYDPENDYRSTPLFQAIYTEQFNIVELLLRTGEIDINLKPHGETVLIFTLQILFDNTTIYVREYHNIIKLLLQHADINVHEETRKGESALDLTIKIENTVGGYPEINREIFKSLTSHKNFKYEKIKDKAFPLLMAIKSASFDFFQFLITSPEINLNGKAKQIIEEIIEVHKTDMSYLELFIQYLTDKIVDAKYHAGIKTTSNPKPKTNPTLEQSEFLKNLQVRVDEIYKDAMIHAVWYDNTNALKFLLENDNLILSNAFENDNLILSNAHLRIAIPSMERTAMLCNMYNTGYVLPTEIMQTIFSLFPVSKSETLTFDFNSPFFLKFPQNLFTDSLSIAAALCETEMVKIILDHLKKKDINNYKWQIYNISYKLNAMKDFQDKEIREAEQELIKARENRLLTPKAQKAQIFLTKLYNLPEENREIYKNRERKFNAIMETIKKVESLFWRACT
jgi:ankyrin repeat protein